MKRFLCRLFGHKWMNLTSAQYHSEIRRAARKKIDANLLLAYCRRCGREERLFRPKA